MGIKKIISETNDSRLNLFAKVALVSVFLCFFHIFPTPYTLHPRPFAYADTARLHDGKEVRGIVVEDYKDRIVMSTISGEVTVKKSDIDELNFDSEEENLIKLGDQAKDRKDYTRAFTYYNLALRKNPLSKAANDGLVFLQGYLFRKEESEKMEDIKRRENLERYGTEVVVEKTKTPEEKAKELTDKLRKVMGLTIEMKDGFPVMEKVVSKSSAADAGIKKGDILISIWGKLTGYMSAEDVMEMLLDKPSLEIKCNVERTIEADINGASFSMELSGLTVSSVKDPSPAREDGLAAGDLVTSIDGAATRYMPLKKALGLMKKAKEKVNLTIRREILIWRGETV